MMQAKARTAIIMVMIVNRCFNQVHVGNHEVSLLQISSNPQKASSWAACCKNWVQISWASVDTLPLWSTYTQQLLLLTMNTLCDAKRSSSAIWGFFISSCNTVTASIIWFSIYSMVAEMFTIVFSNSLTPSQGKNHLMKLWNLAGHSYSLQSSFWMPQIVSHPKSSGLYQLLLC